MATTDAASSTVDFSAVDFTRELREAEASLPDKPLPEGRALTSGQALSALQTDLERRRSGQIVGLPWPPEWPALERDLGPIEPGTLTVIAGRPSTGKTAVSLHLLRHLAGRGHRVLFVTRELSVVRLVRRHVAAFGANLYHLRSGHLDESDQRALEAYERESAEWRVFYSDAARTVDEILTEVILTEPELVVVDYLQRLAYDTDREYAAITRIVNELQDLTLAMNVPVILLSQLSRPQKGQEYKPPAMSDTRGSGAVEERATNLILLHRNWDTQLDEQFGREVRVAKTARDDGYFIIAKAADGESGRFIGVDFNWPRMRVLERL